MKHTDQEVEAYQEQVRQLDLEQRRLQIAKLKRELEDAKQPGPRFNTREMNRYARSWCGVRR